MIKTVFALVVITRSDNKSLSARGRPGSDKQIPSLWCEVTLFFTLPIVRDSFDLRIQGKYVKSVTINHGFILIMDLIEVSCLQETLSLRLGLVTGVRPFTGETLERNVRRQYTGQVSR